MLPVPPLAQTLERFVQTVEPLTTPEELAASRQAAQDFLMGDGPAVQAELERFAQAENEAGRSWLSVEWDNTYLDIGTPLPLTSNFGARLNWPRREYPSHFAAGGDLIRCVATVHLAQISKQQPAMVSPRGEQQSMLQWHYLTGVMRHPRIGRSEVVTSDGALADREIVVLRAGHAYAVRVSDDDGTPISATSIEAALREIVSLPAGDPGVFTWPAYLGSERAAWHLDTLLSDPANQDVYTRLVHALFVVNLVEEAAEPAEHLQRTAFGLGQAWPFKTTCYQLGLADGWTGLHIEHTIPDGGTINEVTARAAAVPPQEPVGDWHCPRIEPLEWAMSPMQENELRRDAAEYAAEASQHHVDIVRVPLELPVQPSFKLSLDGVMQWVMLYAQLMAFGEVRSTYESVAMLEYQAGRTECLRPNTVEAVELARALLAGTATPEQLLAAQQAHSRAVVACKTGQAIDRHLFGLRFTAARLGLPAAALFDGEAYRRLTTDVLSTTSLGSHDQLMQFAFAPTSSHGIGINYAAVVNDDGTAFDFTVTHRADRIPDIQPFLAALRDGTQRLAHLIHAAVGR